MLYNWERGVLVGIVIFLYLSIADKFWPDINTFLNALFLAIIVGVTVKISKVVFKKDK